ncbi:MAG: Nif3-like dinuclear metal center hexameric protein, partial [Bacteroidetes bacterium]
MKLKELTSYLEGLAPLSTQESYDNSGLIVGDPNSTIDKVLIALDCTEEIIEEAVELGAKMVIAHHPIVFKGLKSLTGKNYVERTVIKAIKNDIAIYAIHTNLDNYLKGVNDEICKRIGLVETRVLAPVKGELMKLVVYVPSGHLPAVQEAAFSAGAGNIGNYSECSFST